jgi:hypothetical protein
MWKRAWQKWTLDKPAAFGDLLWDVLVVQFAAWLDRLSWRQLIAFIPVVILGLAYAHSIPLPPELMLVGDVLAYLDIYSVILLLGLLSRTATILLVMKQAIAGAARMTSSLLARTRRLDFRHRREGGRKGRAHGTTRRDEADDGAALHGAVWA